MNYSKNYLETQLKSAVKLKNSDVKGKILPSTYNSVNNAKMYLHNCLELIITLNSTTAIVPSF